MPLRKMTGGRGPTPALRRSQGMANRSPSSQGKRPGTRGGKVPVKGRGGFGGGLTQGPSSGRTFKGGLTQGPSSGRTFRGGLTQGRPSGGSLGGALRKAPPRGR